MNDTTTTTTRRRRNFGPQTRDTHTEAALRKAMRTIARGEEALAERDRLTVKLYALGYRQRDIRDLWERGHGSRTWTDDAVARVVDLAGSDG